MKIIVYIATLSLFFIECNSNRDQSIVAIVNNEVITKEELKYWMLLEKSAVYNSFFRKYCVQYSDHFWTDSFEEERPIDVLKYRALESAKRCKIEQILAHDKGIITNLNFDDLMIEKERINKERIQKVENNIPIYGPKQFTNRTYFFHVHDKLKEVLKKQLAKKELLPDKQEMDSLKIIETDSGKNIINFLIMQYVDIKYEDYIDNLTLEATLEIDMEVYKEMSIH